MRDHVKILAVLNIIMGCLGALAGVVVLIVFGGLAGLAGYRRVPGRTTITVPWLLPFLRSSASASRCSFYCSLCPA